MNGFQLRYKNGVWFGTFTQLEQAGIRHGIATRLGGVSAAPFDTLNLGLHTGDDLTKVRENRRRFCQAVGVKYEAVATAEQVHGDKVFIIDREHAGLGAEIYEQAIRGVDALITAVPDIPLMLFFADCVPVLIADPVKRAVGISHAGWKGTVSAIAAKTVQTMTATYGTDPSDCIAAIGPSIGSCCYEVDEPVISRLTYFSYWQDLVTPLDERWRLDLWEANRRQLIEAGLAAANITVSGICTSCNTAMFFSYRAESGRTGRMGAVIALT